MLAIIAGINILLLSALVIAGTIGSGEDASRTMRIVVGVVGVIAGVIVIRHPADALLAIVLAVGIWLILTGIVDLIGGDHRRRRSAAGGGSWAALADIVIGILIIALPKISLGTVAVLIGIGFIIRGLVLVVGAWRLRGERASAAAGVPSLRREDRDDHRRHDRDQRHAEDHHAAAIHAPRSSAASRRRSRRSRPSAPPTSTPCP